MEYKLKINLKLKVSSTCRFEPCPPYICGGGGIGRRSPLDCRVVETAGQIQAALQRSSTWATRAVVESRSPTRSPEMRVQLSPPALLCRRGLMACRRIAEMRWEIKRSRGRIRGKTGPGRAGYVPPRSFFPGWCNGSMPLSASGDSWFEPRARN